MIDEMYIVMHGNPFEGYQFFGPFGTIDDAQDWGESNSELEWYLVRLEEPEGADYIKGGYYWSDAAKEIVQEMRKANGS